MNILESRWLGERIASMPDAELFPLLNVGSSTAEFRTTIQPWIDKNIFAPMRERGGVVHHLDIKKADGVDLVGDLSDPLFFENVALLKARAVIASNLFEHITNRHEIASAILRLAPSRGYIILSGPRTYPYHADPIDTMFRPTIDQMHAYFPGTEIIDSAIINSGNWRQWSAGERGRSLSRTVMRLMAPFYRPASWWVLACQAPFLFKHITAFALILRKY